jgi:hypothetical protein
MVRMCFSDALDVIKKCNIVRRWNRRRKCGKRYEEMLAQCNSTPCDDYLEPGDLPEHEAQDGYMDCLANRHNKLAFCTKLLSTWLKDCYENGVTN